MAFKNETLYYSRFAMMKETQQKVFFNSIVAVYSGLGFDFFVIVGKSGCLPADW